MHKHLHGGNLAAQLLGLSLQLCHLRLCCGHLRPRLLGGRRIAGGLLGLLTQGNLYALQLALQRLERCLQGLSPRCSQGVALRNPKACVCTCSKQGVCLPIEPPKATENGGSNAKNVQVMDFSPSTGCSLVVGWDINGCTHTRTCKRTCIVLLIGGKDALEAIALLAHHCQLALEPGSGCICIAVR